MGGAFFPRECTSNAKAAAQRAIALDERLADGHVALASILRRLRSGLGWRATEVQRALSLNPAMPMRIRRSRTIWRRSGVSMKLSLNQASEKSRSLAGQAYDVKSGTMPG